MLFSRRGSLTTFLAAAVILPGPIARWFRSDVNSKQKEQRTIYRLSSGGLPVSDAVKEHNANMRFKTREAADRHRAHPTDMSRIVPFKVSVNEYYRLFKRRNSHVADLRQLPHIKATRLRSR
jgi:hypothetical protein